MQANTYPQVGGEGDPRLRSWPINSQTQTYLCFFTAAVAVDIIEILLQA